MRECGGAVRDRHGSSVSTATDWKTGRRSGILTDTNSPAGIINAVLIFVTFALTLPAIAMPTRGWLKLSGYLVVINAVFSVILGLYLWIITLRTKETFSLVWNAQTPAVQDLMQTAVCILFS